MSKAEAVTDNRPERKPYFNWGKGLAVVIVLFICTTLGIVGYLVSLDYHMVTKNHYEKAVKYQDHIDRVERARAMEEPVGIKLLRSEGEIEIRFPSALTKSELSGTVELYRPSDPSLDRRINLLLNEKGILRIPAGELAKGKWLVKVSWTSGEKSYYKQANIFL